MAELIIFAGRFDPDFLKKAHDEQARSGASQPVANQDEYQQKKKRAAEAKFEYRRTLYLRRRLDKGELERRHLTGPQQQNLAMLDDGTLLERTNDAIMAYGHGTLRSAHGDEELEIGGSTGGLSRYLLDGYHEPDLASFLAKK